MTYSVKIEKLGEDGKGNGNTRTVEINITPTEKNQAVSLRQAIKTKAEAQYTGWKFISYNK